MNRRVAVGMSGGVDSSVAALLLKEAGHEVIGVTMSIWPGDAGSAGGSAGGSASARPARDSCYGPGEAADIEDAARVCARLGIPHHVVDLRDAYRELVLEYTRAEYLAGRTPNPCVRCNRLVKFGLLIEKLADAVGGVDAFATGHYARLGRDPNTGRWAVRKAADPAKDQSYFLCLLGQDQLARVLFPLGDLAKPEVRRRAKEAGLDIHDRVESQDFAAGGYRGVVELPDREGPVTDADGTVIGSHRGHWGYTVGQRRGLGVGGGPPLYVMRIDAARNAVVAGPDSGLWRNGLVARDVNWMGFAGLAVPRASRGEDPLPQSRSECARLAALRREGARRLSTSPSAPSRPGRWRSATTETGSPSPARSRNRAGVASRVRLAGGGVSAQAVERAVLPSSSHFAVNTDCMVFGSRSYTSPDTLSAPGQVPFFSRCAAKLMTSETIRPVSSKYFTGPASMPMRRRMSSRIGLSGWRLNTGRL